MKRIFFKSEFVDPIIAGTKCRTLRLKPLMWNPGEVAAACTDSINSQGRKVPAFLTPAKDAFAHLRLVYIFVVKWEQVTEDMIAGCCVNRAWYERVHGSKLQPETIVYLYEFYPSRVTK